jgi:hypothetical protein
MLPQARTIRQGACDWPSGDYAGGTAPLPDGSAFGVGRLVSPIERVKKVSNALLNRFRGQPDQPQSQTVVCPTCQEETPAGALIGQHCKGVLPATVSATGPVTVSVSATASTAEEAAAAVHAVAGGPAATVPCPSCGEAAPVAALICPFCRDVLSPRPEQQAGAGAC